MREAGCVVRVFFFFHSLSILHVYGFAAHAHYIFTPFLFFFFLFWLNYKFFFFFFLANYFILAMTAPRIFLNVFFKKYKLYNLIKREIYILTTTIIKKARKYIRFIIVFYEFSYFEIVA